MKKKKKKKQTNKKITEWNKVNLLEDMLFGRYV